METRRKSVEGEVTASFFARNISNLIPNPWQAYRIAEEVMPKGEPVSKKLYADRMDIVHGLREDIKEQVETESKRLFQKKVGTGEISFHLDATQSAWKMPQKRRILVPLTNGPKYLVHTTSEPLQFSLFENYLASEFNSLEKNVALYLDAQEALKWWHRIAARREYRLQGWKKHGVFPDFVACLKKDGTLAIIETKGAHLGRNDDTEYKEKLFEILEKSANRSDVGKMTVIEEGRRIFLRILMENSWKQEIAEITRDATRL